MACALYYLNGTEFVPLCDYELSNDLDLIYFWLYGVIMTVLIILGLVGNGVTICVFLSPRIWSCLSFYLVALATWDSALLISSFTQWSLWSLWHRKAIPLIGRHVILLRVSYFLVNVTLTGCVWVTVCLTVERYLAILIPLRHRTLNNATRAKILIAVISILAILVNISRFFEVDIVHDQLFYQLPNSSEFIPFPFIMRSTLRDNIFYFIFYRVLAASLLIYVVPCGVLLFLTVQMCWSIRSAIQQRQQICSQQKFDSENSVMRKSQSSQNTNITLIIVLFKFLFCYALPTVIDLIELFGQQYLSESIEKLIVVSNLLVVFNSASNFYIYLLQCRRFAEELHRGCSVLFGNASQSDLNAPMELWRAASPSHITKATDAAGKEYGTFGLVTPRSISLMETSRRSSYAE